MDIVRLPIELADDTRIDSRFRLVAIAAQRAKELAYGAKPKIETRFTKIPTIAIEEAIEGKLDFLIGEEARIANEEARKFDYKRFIEEKKKDTMPEDLTELEKDLRTYLNEREEFDKQVLEELFAERDDDEIEEITEE